MLSGTLTFIIGTAAASRAPATQAKAVFAINQQASSLQIEAEARGFEDSDSKPLAGTFAATFDFGPTVAFPQTTEFTVTGANVTPVGIYRLRLGLPAPFPGVTATASGLVANVVTISPPGIMRRLAGPGVTYQFDASQATLSLVDGIVELSGLVNDSIDLSEDNVSGVPPAGTLGTISFTTGATNGFYTLVNASLNFPVNVSDVAEFGDPDDPEEAQLRLTGNVTATASFYAALAGVPGDFDGDADVDAADLVRFEAGFGTLTGATAGNGDADLDGGVDGADLLAYQRNLGTQPPVGSFAAVPEPGATALLIVAMGGLATSRRRM